MRRATGARVQAEGVGLATREGPVYTGVGFTARPGTLTVFRADSGGGRSALLLTLTGRMRPSEGTLYVDGHALPRHARRVRRISSLGLMDEVNPLDERLRVREHLSEGLLLRMRPAARSLADEAMDAAGLGGLDRRSLVRELSMLERRRLGLALALLAEPRLLAVDDVDGGLEPGHQADLWRTLKGLSDDGLTVVATCADSDELSEVAGPDTQGPIPLRQDAGDPADSGTGTAAGSAGATAADPGTGGRSGRHRRHVGLDILRGGREEGGNRGRA
ncbi:ATP-binding cassette domain-containing protein [Nocardiopsis alborubida]|uniref:ATP-binding cassette domain-containing protein n=1 Tax=Nocardiopsis alborubida TaxID=146802 RepID=A0A7X6MBY6_9ACTN|nr:ATP-binding cassette domain-containing protein [Nocardiopsis alborubida]NKY98472.1 ATP-binding cassette domain-containing protein [Nocardiopsis alborubida]